MLRTLIRNITATRVSLLPLFQALRPKQWPKNVFVFIGVFFDGKILDLSKVMTSVIAFVIFCLISSAIYLINDLADIDKDRKHPTKKNRPLASGALSPGVAIAAATVLLLINLPAAFLLSPMFGAVALAYAVLQTVYTFILKHIVIIDVMAIAAGFVLRVVAGAVVIEVSRFSPWLYVCTTLGALFIAINKRRHELVLLADSANSHRTSLQEYTLGFLDNMTSLVTATALAAYSFYTFSAPNLPANHAMMLTIPFLIYAIFRYLYLIHTKNLGGAPEDIVLGDKPLLISLFLWALTAGVVIYWPIVFHGS